MHEASEQADTRLSELLYLLLYSYLTTYAVMSTITRL